jgi:hypothetical protein
MTEPMARPPTRTAAQTQSRPRRDWQSDVIPVVKRKLSDFEQQGIIPTLRGMFYGARLSLKDGKARSMEEIIELLIDNCSTYIDR